MTSMDCLDAIRLAMSAYFVYQARKDPNAVPTEEDLNRLYTELSAKADEEWEDLFDELVRAAHPFVSEDGTWSRVRDGQTVVEEVGIDDVLAAARYARIQVETAAVGDYALGRAVSDALSAAARPIHDENLAVIHQALAAEQGLY